MNVTLLWNLNIFECKKCMRTREHLLNSEISSFAIVYIDKEFWWAFLYGCQDWILSRAKNLEVERMGLKMKTKTKTLLLMQVITFIVII